MGFPSPYAGEVTEVTGDVGGFPTATGGIDQLLGDDTGDWTAETIAGSYATLVIAADGVWTYTADNSNSAIQALDSGETSPEVFDVPSTGGDSTITTTLNGVDGPPCFTRGARTDTPLGPRPVESLEAGDAVLTADKGVQVMRWVGSRKLRPSAGKADEKLRPGRNTAQRLGPCLPACDILVSPMHRVVVGVAQTGLLSGQTEVLAAARHLVNGRTILTETLSARIDARPRSGAGMLHG